MDKIKKYIYYGLICFTFLLGVVLRTKVYLSSGVFEDDECRLGLSMMNLNIWQMFGPLGPWSSSPIFMFVSKIIAHFSHYNEYALEFLPYVFSLAGMFMFYKLTNEYFERKFTTIIANYFFAVNIPILFFSATFKQYSLEVLAALLCLYYFPKINLLKMNFKQTLALSAILALLPLLSLPSLFYIGTFILINLYINRNEFKEILKKILVTISPFLTVMIFFYVYNLAPTKRMQEIYYSGYWDTFYSHSIFVQIIGNIRYFFEPNKQILWIFILLIISLIIVLFDRTKRKTLDVYMFLVYGFIIFASFTNIFPFMTRAALHFIPAATLLVLKPIDSLDYKKIPFYFILLLWLIGFAGYFSPKALSGEISGFVGYAPNSLLQIINKDFNSEKDYVIINEASFASYYFYLRKNNLNKLIEERTNQVAFNKEVRADIYNYLNNLEPGRNYWFYLIKEYEDSQRKYIMEWLENQNVQKKIQERKSYLYYITPPYKKVEP